MNAESFYSREDFEDFREVVKKEEILSLGTDAKFRRKIKVNGNTSNL